MRTSVHLGLILGIFCLAACRPPERSGAVPGRVEGRLAAPDVVLATPPDNKAVDTFPAVEDGSRIDVLYLYTSRALAGTGGLSGLEAKAYANDAFLNVALRESLPEVRPAPRVNIVGFGEIPDSSPASTGSLARNSAVMALRARYKADVVVAIHHGYTSGAGIANVFCNNPVSHSQGGYVALIGSRSMMYYMSPAHELGHLLGAGHDYEYRTITCLYEDSRGWSFWLTEADGRQVRYGTLMDYQGTVRIPRFSNPNVSYRGVPTGVAGQADNARAVNAARHFIANYVPTTEPYVPPAGGPHIRLTAGGRSTGGAGWLAINATITDSDGVGEVHLLWDDGSALACPNQNMREWNCTKSGDQYTWRIRADAGERFFRIRALDMRGTRSVTPQRDIVVQ